MRPQRPTPRDRPGYNTRGPPRLPRGQNDTESEDPRRRGGANSAAMRQLPCPMKEPDECEVPDERRGRCGHGSRGSMCVLSLPLLRNGPVAHATGSLPKPPREPGGGRGAPGFRGSPTRTGLEELHREALETWPSLEDISRNVRLHRRSDPRTPKRSQAMGGAQAAEQALQQKERATRRPGNGLWPEPASERLDLSGHRCHRDALLLKSTGSAQSRNVWPHRTSKRRPRRPSPEFKLCVAGSGQIKEIVVRLSYHTLAGSAGIILNRSGRH